VFVAFEGVEGSGKSTQAARLAERLRSRGLDPLLVREPGGTPLAEEMRRLVLHAPGELTAASELFLFQAARSDLTERVIRPALAAGRAVIADRYELSTRAYQVAGRGLPEADVLAAIRLATGGLAPDIYVVLDLDVAASRRRQSEQGKAPDRIERADDDFHRRVAGAFKAAAGPGIVHLAAEGSADAVHDAVWGLLVARFPGLA